MEGLKCGQSERTLGQMEGGMRVASSFFNILLNEYLFSRHLINEKLIHVDTQLGASHIAKILAHS